MKQNRKHIFQFAGLVAAIIVLITSCNESSELGLEILPGQDLFNVEEILVKDQISAFANNEYGIVTSRSTYNLIGSLNDPLFGQTNVNFATQVRLSAYPDFGSNPVVDSTYLYLYYRGVYGDTITPQHLTIYELTQSIDADEEYKQDVDLKSLASTIPVGEHTFTPKVELDSATQDTLYQVIKIPIDNSIGEKLSTADSLDLISNDVFLEFFKGFYIEAEEINTPGSGSLLKLEAASSSTFQGSALVVYYDNDENESEGDTLSSAFIITEYSARVNNIMHDYTGTPFVDEMDQEIEQDEYIFIQPTGGLKSLIEIEQLEGWRDSLNTSINKAELVFQVDTVASDLENYPPPSSLILTFVDVDSVERLPIDYYFNPTFYGGYLLSDYTYHFNITQHLQRVINVLDPEDEDYVGNQGFYLTTGQKSDDAKRVVLEGTDRDSGVKLIITYTKYLQ